MVRILSSFTGKLACTYTRLGKNGLTVTRNSLPTPRPGQVLGLVGTNGIGKSTALKVLAGKLKPNLGKLNEETPDWAGVIRYFRGSELQTYFTKLLEDDLQAVVKPQYVDQIPKAIRGPEKSVGAIFNKQADASMGNLDAVLDVLELRHLQDREVIHLSGGELQRFALGLVCVQQKDMYAVIQSIYHGMMLTELPATFLTNPVLSLISSKD